MSGDQVVMGVDIGGTHITAALVNTVSGQLIRHSLRRRRVNAAAAAETVIAEWVQCIRESMVQGPVDVISFAMPGPIDYDTGISYMRGQDKYEYLYGLNLKDLLAQALGFPRSGLFMYNDASCFLQGEIYAGCARSYAKDKMIGITLGTGLGSAVYNNGASTSADKWCVRFKGGIAEDFLSTRWFTGRWEEITGVKLSGVRELGQVALDGDTAAKHIFSEFGDHLGQFVFDFAQAEKPQAVVIGGNIAKAHALFIPSAEKVLRSLGLSLRLLPAAIGEEALLLGAVSNWNHHLRKQPG
ncbi:ROK family protein [Niabella yanshanensis]|nr:ROK family protein [Niabella yanshanensis]